MEDGSQANVNLQAEALRDLLLSLNNLSELIFGVGSGAAAWRPPFEEAIQQAFGTTQLTKVRLLSIEDTALFWTGICAQAHDLTVYLGYAGDRPEWPNAPAIRKLTLHHTSLCHPADKEIYSNVPPLTMPRAAGDCGSGRVTSFLSFSDRRTNDAILVITKAMPCVKTLNLADCDKDFRVQQHGLPLPG